MTLGSIWTGDIKGNGRIEGDGFSIEIGIPAVYGGSGAGADPKQLFVSSTLACFIASLRAITDNKKIPVEHLEVVTEATTDDKDFSIKHTANVTLSPGSTDMDVIAAEAAVQSAEKVCLIGNLAKKAGIPVDIVTLVTVSDKF
ncbi:osmotically inducible protein OsmC [Brucella tritici]|uniref:Osmotically inducible protein OsmC n=2 Tax=Hyphomicrobiales TaxID=356 RepID=A0A6L3Y5Z3_9HYPH|nr:osmotically inducible protein OsmC [Brucella tritici]